MRGSDDGTVNYSAMWTLMRVRTALRCFSQARRPIRAELGQIERIANIVATAPPTCSCSWRSAYPNSQNLCAEVLGRILISQIVRGDFFDSIDPMQTCGRAPFGETYP